MDVHCRYGVEACVRAYEMLEHLGMRRFNLRKATSNNAADRHVLC